VTDTELDLTAEPKPIRDWHWFAYSKEGNWLGFFKTEADARAWAEPRGHLVSNDPPVRAKHKKV
jgi:hypothetical protein